LEKDDRFRLLDLMQIRELLHIILWLRSSPNPPGGDHIGDRHQT